MRFTSALLSFFLPGLGQLSQKRFPWAIGFFMAFAIAVATAKVWWLAPIIALASGLETMRVPSDPTPFDRKRKAAYGVVGGLGFLSWFGFAVSNFFPLDSQMKINADVEKIRSHFRRCYSLQPSKQTALGCLREVTDSAAADPWDSKYQLMMSEGILEVRSLGPDQLSGTEDDLVYRSVVDKGALPQ